MITDKPPSWEGWPPRWLITVILVGTALALVAPMMRFPSRWAEPYDWRYFQAMEEVFRISVTTFHQVPLWNPYACGGEVALANPQSTVAVPTFLLSLAFGTPLGLRLALLVYFLAALHGTWLLGRALGASRAGALVAALAFVGCGWFAMHLSSGHVNFAGAALYPYLIYFFLRASRADERGGWIWVIPAAAMVAWMAGLGGTYTVPMAVVLVGTWAVAESMVRRTPRPILVAAALGLLALALGAARFLPLLEFALDHPRPVSEHDANNVADLARMLFAWNHTLEATPGHTYWWHEYGCHLPYLALALAAFALVGRPVVAAQPRTTLESRWRRERRPRPLDLALVGAFAAWTVLALALPAPDRWLARHLLSYRDAYHLLGLVALLRIARGAPPALLAVAVVATGIVVGDAWPHGPWWLIRHLPLYHDLRVPSRYLVLVALVLSLLAGLGLDDAAARWAGRGRSARALAAAAIGVVLVETLAFAVPAYKDARFLMMREPPTDMPAFYQAPGSWQEMLDGVIARRGTLSCDEEAPLQRGELDPGPGEQARLLDPGAGTVTAERWSPNEVALAVDLSRPTIVLINQNWNEHWTAQGGRVRSVEGRLGVATEAGRRRLLVRYRPRSFVVGAWVSALALPLALAAFIALRKWSARSS